MMVMLFTIVSALELNVTRHSGLLEEFYEEFEDKWIIEEGD